MTAFDQIASKLSGWQVPFGIEKESQIYENNIFFKCFEGCRNGLEERNTLFWIAVGFGGV